MNIILLPHDEFIRSAACLGKPPTHHQERHDQSEHGNNRGEDLDDKNLDEQLCIGCISNGCVGSCHAYGGSTDEIAQARSDTSPEEHVAWFKSKLKDSVIVSNELRPRNEFNARAHR